MMTMAALFIAISAAAAAAAADHITLVLINDARGWIGAAGGCGCG